MKQEHGVMREGKDFRTEDSKSFSYYASANCFFWFWTHTWVMSVSQPFTYAQECLRWADTGWKPALPYYALFCLWLWWNILWILALVTTGTNDITTSQYLIPPPSPFWIATFFCFCHLCFTSLSLSLPPFLLCLCLSVHVKTLFKVFRVLSRKLLASLKGFCMKATVVRITIIPKFQWTTYSCSEVLLFHHNLSKPIKYIDINICLNVLTYHMGMAPVFHWGTCIHPAHMLWVLVWAV